MTNVQVKARKLELKKQFFQVRGIDQIDKIERAILLGIKRRYEEQMNGEFDPDLSRKIDCLNFLIDKN